MFKCLKKLLWVGLKMKTVGSPLDTINLLLIKCQIVTLFALIEYDRFTQGVMSNSSK